MKWAIPIAFLVLILLFGCVQKTKDTIPVSTLGNFLPRPAGYQMFDDSPELNPNSDSYGQHAMASYHKVGDSENAVDFDILDTYRKFGSPDWKLINTCLQEGKCIVKQFEFADGALHKVYVVKGTMGTSYYAPVTNRTLIMMTVWEGGDDVAATFFKATDWNALRAVALETHEDE